MTSTTAPTQSPPSPGRRVLVISLAIVAGLVAAFFLFANVFADFLWFDQMGFESVLITQWVARIVMFVIGFLGMALPLWGAIQLAYRLRPVYARLSSQLDRYQEVVEPLRRLAMWGIPIFFGVFAGLSASSQWELAWMWANGVPSGTVDPQFGLDNSFYMFALPFYRALVAFISAVLLICLLVTAFVSYLYGSIRVGQGELRISKSARIQIAIIAGLYLLAQAVSLWLDRYWTLIDSQASNAGGGSIDVTGPTYAIANAVIPGQTILAIAAALVAVLFFVTAFLGRWRFPLVGTALLVVAALVLGIAYPWAVTTFQVKPNGVDLEATYYERNIKGTQQAFGLDGIEKTDFKAETTAEAGQLRSDAETTAQVRIMDPAIISPTVRQLEQYKPYYQFQQTMDVDRYQIDGESQDVVVSVRDLDMSNVDSQWQNQATVYTHGYGIVAAAGNQRTDDGNPKFLEQGIPASGFLSTEKFEPRVYFGETSPQYSIVGAPKGSEPVEMDYPRGTDGATETKTTFSGDGGPKIDNIFTKLIYSMKFGSGEILFSDRVNSESQILYDRDPKTRVQKAAPYLTLDNDPYPSVVDGRIVWIVDGYTTSSSYPYSSGVSLSQAIGDTDQSRGFAIDEINYMRNSVKATVDAYDGSVTLYAWDDADPVLKTWQKVYPSTLKPMSEMSGDLMSHVRYPTDLFKVQRNVLGVYHVDNARSFFQADNVWTTPNDPNTSGANTRLQPPYYLSMRMPGQDQATYSMFTSFIPRSTNAATARNVLTGYMAVDSDAGNEKGKKAEDYGKLRMLVIDSDTTVPGPGQVKNAFDADGEVSRYLNLLKQGQSDVLNGNLLTLPVGGGLLYVQPVYVQSSGSTQLPHLQKVLVAFGDQVAFEDTLSEALDRLFGGDSGADTGDANVTPVTPEDIPDTGTTPAPNPSPSATPGASPSPSEGSTGGTDEASLLQTAKKALQDREAAMQKGDWTAYGEADKQLTDALEKLLALDGQ